MVVVNIHTEINNHCSTVWDQLYKSILFKYSIDLVETLLDNFNITTSNQGNQLLRTLDHKCHEVKLVLYQTFPHNAQTIIHHPNFFSSQ